MANGNQTVFRRSNGLSKCMFLPERSQLFQHLECHLQCLQRGVGLLAEVFFFGINFTQAIFVVPKFKI